MQPRFLKLSCRFAFNQEVSASAVDNFLDSNKEQSENIALLVCFAPPLLYNASFMDHGPRIAAEEKGCSRYSAANRLHPYFTCTNPTPNGNPKALRMGLFSQF